MKNFEHDFVVSFPILWMCHALFSFLSGLSQCFVFVGTSIEAFKLDFKSRLCYLRLIWRSLPPLNSPSSIFAATTIKVTSYASMMLLFALWGNQVGVCCFGWQPLKIVVIILLLFHLPYFEGIRKHMFTIVINCLILFFSLFLGWCSFIELIICSLNELFWVWWLIRYL